MYDIAIIGAGVIGCAIARELAKYRLKIGVIEKHYDVANETSKANSGIVHPGEDPVPGTMKAKMNIRGNKMFEQLREELNFPFKRTGALVLCFDQGDIPKLETLRQRGLENGMPDTMEILYRKEALALEPNLGGEVVAVLTLPTGGIVCPYGFTIALAENAYTNGVAFLFNTEVKKLTKEEDFFHLATNQGVLEARIVINAAGVYADKINNMISKIKYHILPRKGEYLLFDKVAGQAVSRTLFQIPTLMGKGVLVTPTVSGNLLVGPTAKDMENRSDVTTTKEALKEVMQKGERSVQAFPMNQLITSFAGLRAHEEKGDFVIGEALDVSGFINALGIESPGLTSAPAIAEYITNLVIKKTQAPPNKNFNPIRKKDIKFSEATEEERKELIKKDKRYGKIVCRCENVTEAEIIQAIEAPLGAKTVDAVKRRTRAGMGRCQSGFCMNRVLELLAEAQNKPIEEISKSGEGSEILVGNIKGNLTRKGE